MIKLMATDMDGSFLRDDMTYDEAQFALLYQQLQLRGVRFVIASGNQYFQLKSFFKDYPEMIYLAEMGLISAMPTTFTHLTPFSQTQSRRF